MCVIFVCVLPELPATSQRNLYLTYSTTFTVSQMLAARMVYRQADEAFEEGIKKEATYPENFDDASIIHTSQ